MLLWFPLCLNFGVVPDDDDDDDDEEEEEEEEEEVPATQENVDNTDRLIGKRCVQKQSPLTRIHLYPSKQRSEP